MNDTSILDTLPVEQRLALAYAPSVSRGGWTAGLALDVRLARIVLSSRETMLGQIRLAWWRDRLAADAPPGGEPLLRLIHASQVSRRALSALVDAWEEVLLDADGQHAEPLEHIAAARAGWITGLGGTGDADAGPAAMAWALADMSRMPSPHGALAQDLAERADWRRPRVSRPLRPLAILHALARRSRGRAGSQGGPATLLVAARVGLLGV
ncbi:phytoene synthase [Novosphingobium kunmingense]|uniref:Phytoene synthase n=1 Tax=Novosphingobium kunmingense TaxID=1211806 RepID=A0A2N0I2R7_9SPHN|nr:hypothetical protein [Novosphingobium kunmingense]PKB25498.1 phytoene synthase [Novosphingobium kunmingense]